MNVQTSQSNLAGRRAELMAQLFFQDLGPVFVSQPTTPDLGYDLLVGFANKKGGINNVTVEVKSTENPPGTHFQLSRRDFNLIAHSNVPGLLLVADVKQNRLYYSWLSAKEQNGRGSNVSIPLIEINEATTRELKRQLERLEGGIAVAG